MCSATIPINGGDGAGGKPDLNMCSATIPIKGGEVVIGDRPDVNLCANVISGRNRDEGTTT